MERSELVARLNAVLAEEFEIETEKITPQAEIKPTLMLDSLSLVDMVALIEHEFKVSIKGTEAAAVRTFEALYDFIYNRMNAA